MACEDGGGSAPANGGRVWVIDQPALKVAVYTYGGERLFDFGEIEYFFKPNCIAVDRRDGSAWVLDYYVNKLRKYDAEGNLVYETPGFEGGEPLILRGTSLAVDQETGACWLADRSHNRVLKFNAAGGVAAKVTGFNSPRSVSLVPASGECWVADELNDRVVKLPADVAGEVNADDVALASCAGFDVPFAVAADPAGGVWVLDKGAGAVVKVTAAGKKVATVTGFDFPYDAVVSRGADAVFVVDENKGIMAVIARDVDGEQPLSAAAKFTLTGFTMPTDVELDEDGGFVFVADGDALRRYTTAGTLVVTYEGLTTPVMASADPE